MQADSLGTRLLPCSDTALGSPVLTSSSSSVELVYYLTGLLFDWSIIQLVYYSIGMCKGALP